MTRQLIESTLTTRAARASLELGFHWRGIDREVHLGYRKTRRGVDRRAKRTPLAG